MNYMDWLKKEYEPRFITPKELQKSDKYIKPLDFIPFKSFKEFQQVAEMKQRLKNRTEDGEVCAHLDFTFVSCFYEDRTESSCSYAGSVVAVTPYAHQNEVPHKDFKTFLTGVFNEHDMTGKFNKYMEEGTE